MKGLLKFCFEATKGEDAPDISDPEKVLNDMEPQRRRWLEEALARYRAEGQLQPDLINTEVLLDMVTEETEPDIGINNPDHTHPLASVFDRWTANKKTYLTNLLLTGLSCQQIKMLRNGDFLEILAVYR